MYLDKVQDICMFTSHLQKQGIFWDRPFSFDAHINLPMHFRQIHIGITSCYKYGLVCDFMKSD